MAKIFMLPYFPKHTLVNYWSWKMSVNRFKQQNKIKQFEIQKIFSVPPSENYLERELRFVSSWDKNKTLRVISQNKGMTWLLKEFEEQRHKVKDQEGCTEEVAGWHLEPL